MLCTHARILSTHASFLRPTLAGPYQVSHHIHCNDEAFDEDVFSAFPLLRFDPRLPRAWYHRWQHIYMWAAFPFLQIAFQVCDDEQ